MPELMRKLFCFFLAILILFSGIFAHADEASAVPENLYAQSAVLMDAFSGRILYEKNGREFMANASTTKILTCILALESKKTEELVQVSAYAASMPDVQLNIREGEQYLLQDLLYSLMLESHNDTAVAIAEHVAGSCQEFSRLMNEKARSIGCSSSWFITPNGLDATQTITTKTGESVTREHGTTAADLALIMRYCIEESPEREAFLKITGTGSYSFSDKTVSEKGEILNGSRSFYCRNHNSFLQMMEGALSGKTGFTGKAGYCYVGALTRNEKTYIVALLACGWPNNRNYKWQDTRKLMEYGLSAYELCSLEEVRPKQKEIYQTEVKEAQGGKIGQKIMVNLSREEDGKNPCILLKEEEKLSVKVEKYPLTAPVRKGEKAGKILYLINDELWKSENLIITETVDKIDMKWCVERCIDLFWI
ncbi:MAG: D-alanyl-D-alanine carboxypeptidase family protein [Lachnospiraceae bacterium]